MDFITSQKKLAQIVGCSEVHISRVKARKGGLSAELAQRLSQETKISIYLWLAGPKPSLRKQLRQFFEDQKMEAIFNSHRRTA